MVLLPVKEHKVNRVTKGLAVVAALLPLVAVPTAGAAMVPPLPSPATVLTVFPWEGSMEDELQGFLCQAQGPVSRSIGPSWTRMAWLLLTPPSTLTPRPPPKSCLATARGRLVTGWLEQHADDPDAPSPEELSFVLIGNSTRAYGGTAVG